MTKKEKSAQINLIVSVSVAIAAFAYFAYAFSTPGDKSSESPPTPLVAKDAKSAPSGEVAATADMGKEGAVHPPVGRRDLPPDLPEDMVRALNSPPPELPEDLKAQLNAPPPELPEDLKRQLMAPPPELPDDLKAQIGAPPPELPDDIKRALKTPPRVVTIDEVNTPPEPEF